MLTIKSGVTPDVLLKAIESDPDSFAEGRRNDDVCNWFFAKMLVEEMDGSRGMRDDQFYVDEFQKLYDHRLSRFQKDSLYRWDDSWDSKIENCFRLYHGLPIISEGEARRSVKGIVIAWLWIDQGGYRKPE